MKTILVILFTCYCFSFAEEEAAWKQVEIYMFTRDLQINETIQYKMEAQDTVWKDGNITDAYNEAFYPPSGTVGNTEDGSNSYNVAGFNFMGNQFEIWGNFANGLYKMSVVGRNDWFTIDYRDDRYTTYSPATGHPQDIWIRYSSSTNKFSYKTNFVDMEDIDGNNWTEISNGSNLTIWEIKGQSSYGSPSVNKFQPTTPQSLSITNYNGNPKLTWTVSEPTTAAKYRIYRNNILIYTAGAGVTTYIDEQVDIGGGSNKTYKIRAVSGDLTKLSPNYSNEASISGIFVEKHSSEVYPHHDSKMISELSDIYPNPFNPETMIRYTIGEAQNVNISIFDATGREVSVLLNEEKPEGRYEISFNASHLSSGIYYCRLTSGSYMDTKKLVLQK